jgi:hypothetical protein
MIRGVWRVRHRYFTHHVPWQKLYFLIVSGLIVIGVTASIRFYVQTINVLRPSGTKQDLECGPAVLRPLKADFRSGGRQVRTLGQARPVGGPSARIKGPTDGLAELRIANSVRVAEGLSDIMARWPGIGRRRHDQKAYETSGGTLKKDPRHRSLTLVVCVV